MSGWCLILVIFFLFSKKEILSDFVFLGYTAAKMHSRFKYSLLNNSLVLLLNILYYFNINNKIILQTLCLSVNKRKCVCLCNCMLLRRVEHESSSREVESPVTRCDKRPDSSVDAFCKMGLWVGFVLFCFVFFQFNGLWVVSMDCFVLPSYSF